MYRLYARENTGSAAVEALLAILGVQYELMPVAKTASGTAPKWYFAVNPRGEVPTLVLPDGSMMTESAAMMIHLADAHPEAGMAPGWGTAGRAQYLRWMTYMASAAYGTDLRLYYPERYSTDASHAHAIKAKASLDLARDFQVFAEGMGEGPFVLGATMTAADVYAAMILQWSDDVQGLFVKHPKLKQLYDAVGTHPAVRKIWNRNGIA
jgi:glutathione S-transferase